MASIKIHIAHCGRSPEPWLHQYDALRELTRLANPALHQWSEDPEKADYIFLINSEQPGGSLALGHPLLQRFPEKCLLLSEQWQPPFFLAGIYANAPRRLFGRGRFRSGSYQLHHFDFQNPLIQRHSPANDVPAVARDLLFSFLGRDCHSVRTTLFKMTFKRRDVIVENTSYYNAFSHENEGKAAAQERYYQISRRSKFILCPRGSGPSSIRLFEALRLGIAPIIVADEWVPCEGPDWNSFAIFIRSRQLHRLEEIANAAEPHFAELGRNARAAYEAFFAPDKYFNFLVASACSIRAHRWVPEAWFVKLLPVRRHLFRLRQSLARRLGQNAF